MAERLLWVCLGSALGGGARYLVGVAAATLLGTGFPYGTLLVNVTGCVAIGALLRIAAEGHAIGPGLQLFLVTGVLGGFTTYSSFNHETLALLRDGPPALGLLYLAGTVVLCLAAGAIGLSIGRFWT
jgi:CrcB protein